ncbi:MAG: ATP-binding protein [Planctomycetota bacterium]
MNSRFELAAPAAPVPVAPPDGPSAPRECWRAWTALLLVRRAISEAPDRSPVIPPDVRARLGRWLVKKENNGHPPLPETALAELDDDIRRARERIAALPNCPVRELARRHGLSVLAEDMVGLLFAIAADPGLTVLREGLSRVKEYRLTDEFRAGEILGLLRPAAGDAETLEFLDLLLPGSPLFARGILWRSEDFHGDENDPDPFYLELGLSPTVMGRLLGHGRDYAELTRWLDLSVPATDMARVVLPEELKTRILSAADAWRARPAGDSTGLVMIFAGPSGTGKTLTAEALAGRYQCPLVRMKTGAMSRGGDRKRLTDSIEMISRVLEEAMRLKGIAFFDECDDLFPDKSRESGHLLRELERYSGMVIFATNEPGRLDLAMERRFSLRVTFPLPGVSEREALWRIHLPADSLAPDVNLDDAARRVYLTGGFIRKAAEMACLRANGRLVGQVDILAAAKEQQESHYWETVTDFLSPGVEEPPLCDEDSLRILEGLVRAGADAARRKGRLAVRLCGVGDMGTIGRAAKYIAWRLRRDVYMMPRAIRSTSKKKNENDGDDIIYLYRIQRMLPKDAIVTFGRAWEIQEVETVLGIVEHSDWSGIVFFLDYHPVRRKSWVFHLEAVIAPAGPERRIQAWTKALERIGETMDPAVIREIATRYSVDEFEIPRAVVRARACAVADEKDHIEPADLAEAAEYCATTGGEGLFG